MIYTRYKMNIYEFSISKEEEQIFRNICICIILVERLLKKFCLMLFLV